jgi:hypothetical protein
MLSYSRILAGFRVFARSAQGGKEEKMQTVDNDAWLSKADAARVLGVSVRQLELKTAQGLIRKETLPKKPNERAARVVYSREDLDAIRAGSPNRHGEAAPERTLARREQSPNPFADFAERLAGLAFAAQSAKADLRPWLTLDEAAEYSGLTRAWLLKEAEAGENAITVRDMGKHARGGRWRFLRADLGRGE